MQHDVAPVDTAAKQHLPSQAPPVVREVAGSAMSASAGVEANDYNDPVYFFLNWPSSL